MLYSNINFFILAACIIIPISSLVVTLYFIFKKASSRSNTSNANNRKDKIYSFKDEVAVHVICQQLDAVLLNTIDEIEKNRNFLKQYLDRMNQANQKELVPIGGKENYYNSKQVVEERLSDVENNDDQKTDIEELNNSTACKIEYNFDCISELVRSGLTSKQISENTKIPKSEVDLYIKLHLKEKQTSNHPVSLFRLSV